MDTGLLSSAGFDDRPRASLRKISVAELVDLLRANDELAVIDPREEGDFVHAHLFAAANLPFSRLELTIESAVPRQTTPIVVVDDLSGLGMRAIQCLLMLGYTDVRYLSGGIAAWHASGFPLFKGLNVQGKAFGEYVEHSLQPPSISADALMRSMDNGRPPMVIDTRTTEEHADHCLPAALNCPNGELSVRALELIASETGPVVLHCAGRTRSIIGAQTLKDLGVGNNVSALIDGTAGWREIGGPLESGARRLLPATQSARNAGKRAAQKLFERVGIRKISVHELSVFRADPKRTTLLFDIRTAEEFAEGSTPDARHVPGGQLIQTVDAQVIVRNARVVLCDDDGTRAGVLAVWLQRMGFRDVFVFAMGTLETPLNPHQIDTPNMPDQPPPVLGDLIVDIRSSQAYYQGHIPGSWFLTRADLARDLRNLPKPGPVALIAEDEAYADLVTRDAATFGFTARTILNGFARWRDQGGPIETGFTRLASPPNDMWFDGKHLRNPRDIARETRRHLAWQRALIDEISDEPSVQFQ